MSKSPKTPEKNCLDCAFCIEKRIFWGKVYNCHLMRSPVDGNSTIECSVTRSGEGLCGPSGKWFQKKNV